MSDPTYAPRLVGDYADDDGQIIDQNFETVQAPPDVTEVLVPLGESTTTTRPPRPSRVLSEFFNYDSNAAPGLPRMILPADPRRTSVKVATRGFNGASSGSDLIYLADEPNKLPSLLNGTPPSGQAFRCYVGQTADFGDHTGPVWACLGKALSPAVSGGWVLAVPRQTINGAQTISGAALAIPDGVSPRVLLRVYNISGTSPTASGGLQIADNTGAGGFASGVTTAGRSTAGMATGVLATTAVADDRLVPIIATTGSDAVVDAELWVWLGPVSGPPAIGVTVLAVTSGEDSDD